jgi:hypothetical protein
LLRGNGGILEARHNLLTGPEASPEFAGVVDGWVAELKRQLNEWFEHNPGLAPDAASFELVASGGGFDQPGLLDYLKAQAGLNLKPWPKGSQPDAVLPRSASKSLSAPRSRRSATAPNRSRCCPTITALPGRKRLNLQRLELAVSGWRCFACCSLRSAPGTKWSLINRKQALLAKVQAGQEAVEANDALTAELAAEYESFRPLFASQQNTLDTLKRSRCCNSPAAIAASGTCSWPTSKATSASRRGLASTNKLSRTNLLRTLASRSRGNSSEFPAASATSTNLSPAKPGFIAELCIPEDADGARRMRRQLVDELKEQRLFSKVDLLSDDLRRNLADPKVIIPDRDFVLALDFAETEFQQHCRPEKPLPGGPSRPTSRRATRPRGRRLKAGRIPPE